MMVAPAFLFFFFMAASGLWYGAKRVRADYDGLLWTNMSCVEIALVQTDDYKQRLRWCRPRPLCLRSPFAL